jgi:hypothetical protein
MSPLRPAQPVRVAALAAVVLVAVACGSASPSPSAHSSIPASGAPASSAPSESLPPAPPDFGGDLPAGIQFGAAQTLPAGFSGVNADVDGTLMFFGNGGGGPAVAMLDGSTWQTTLLPTPLPFSGPDGFQVPNDPRAFFPREAAAGPHGIVVAGNARANNVSVAGSNPTAAVGVLWSSPDGASWTLVDPREVLGGGAMAADVWDVAATDDGFIAVGTAGPTDESVPQSAFILASEDGRSWSVVEQPTSPWAMAALRVFVGDERLTVSGWEKVCRDPNLGTLYGAGGGHLRLWLSDDGGSTWDEVPIDGAAPVLDTPEEAPAPADCPPMSDAEGLARFETSGSLLGLADDRVVALSAMTDQVAVSSPDLTDWTISDLPDALATAGVNGGPPRTAAALLTDDDEIGWVVREMQPQRDAAGAQVGTDCQVFWWASTDAGATWYAGPMARPVNVCTGGFFGLAPLSDGSVIYTMGAAPVTPNPISAYLLSIPGPLEPFE